MGFPYAITPVDPIMNERLLKDFIGEKDGFIQVGPKKYFFPSSFTKHAEEFYSFEARPDDIWISTFPRSGTTMTQELIWLIANDFDFVRAQQEPLMERFPFFEYSILLHDQMKEQLIQEQQHNPANQNAINNLFHTPVHETLANANSPRFIKTHFPFSLLPPSVMTAKAKVIYVARHPKDVAVSWFHLNRLFKNHGFVNDFAQFWDYFEKDLTLWSPYWEHVKEGWEHRDDPNVLFLFYEDLIKNLPGNILKIAAFLDKPVNDENLRRLVEHLKIDNFRNNNSVNLKNVVESGFGNANEPGFIRSGKAKTTEWQPEYTPEVAARAKKWMRENLRGTSLIFPE